MNIDKLTLKAKEAIAASQQSAVGRSHTIYTPLHLLEALLTEEQGIAVFRVDAVDHLGFAAVIALLLVLAAQAGTGLFIETDDFFESGPLYGYVSEATVNSLTWWHHFLSKVLLALVVLHLAAILFYRLWKREDLVKPMITGWKWVRTRSVGRSDEASSSRRPTLR